MKKFLNLLLVMSLASPQAFARGKIQNEDVKSLSDIQSAVTITGNVSSGSACVASPSSLTGLSAGLFAYDATTPGNIGSGVTITAIPGTCSAGQIQLSSNSLGNGTGDTLNFGGQASQLVNDTKIYVTANSINSQLSSAITNGLLGGGGGSKNYLANGVVASNGSGTPNPGNGDFEKGTTTGWSLAHSAISSNIPTSTATAGSAFSASSGGTAASGNLSQTIVSSGQIQKNYSNNYASSAASVAGDMLISDGFYIDTEDQAKIMQIKFYYKVNSGAANINLSGTSSNSFSIWAYDVTNAQWIQPAGVYNIVQSSGQGYATATFQTSSSGTRYQLALINNAASSGAFSLYVDDWSVGPQIAPMAPAMSDWGTCPGGGVFTGTWVTNTTYSGICKRVGDHLMVGVRVTLTGAPTATSLAINLPFTIDTTKFPSGTVTTERNPIFGTWSSGNGTNFQYGNVQYGTATSVYLFYQSATSGAAMNGLITNTVPFSWASGYTIDANFEVPIVGYSSNTVASADTDTRVVAGLAPTASTSLPSANTAVQLNLGSATSDTHGGFSSNTYIVPVSGTYSLGGYLIYNSGTYTANATNLLSYSINSASVGPEIGATATFGATYIPRVVGAVDGLSLKAGDVIRWWATSGTSGAIVLATTGSQVWIKRTSGPAVVSATETVSARYYASSSTISGSQAVITYSTKDWDTHGAYSGGTYTCPVSGKYQVNASIFTTFTALDNASRVIYLYKNGSLATFNENGGPLTTTGTAPPTSSSLSDLIQCNAGDTLQIKAIDQDTSPSILSSNFGNYLSIVRVGN